MVLPFLSRLKYLFQYCFEDFTEISTNKQKSFFLNFNLSNLIQIFKFSFLTHPEINKFLFPILLIITEFFFSKIFYISFNFIYIFTTLFTNNLNLENFNTLVFISSSISSNLNLLHSNFTRFQKLSYIGKEWFIKSYLFKNKLKWKAYYFTQGFDEIINYKFKFIHSCFNWLGFWPSLSYSKEKFYFPKHFLSLQKLFFKKRFYTFNPQFYIISIKNFLLLNLFASTINKKFHSSFTRGKTLLLYKQQLEIIPFLKTFLNFTSNTLNYLTNYSLLFNKYFNYDSYSSLNTSIFFQTANSSNFFFFFWMLDRSNLISNFKKSWMVSNFEIFFFKKELFFWPISRLFRHLQFTITTFWKLFKFKKKNKKKKLNFLLKKSYWFNVWFFLEELFHLSYLSNFLDFEWVQQIVRAKQLAELRLVKLTNYLQVMREQKIEIGNIQYSPDFTQAHEFALTLKWGFELEQLKFSWLIILWRFFGEWDENDESKNFTREKINFIYNVKKIKFNDYKSNPDSFIVNAPIVHFLSLRNIYELARIFLATILASYRSIYQENNLQLDQVFMIAKCKTETQQKNFYKFLTIAFQRKFLNEMYNQYYKKTQIKRWISFKKMITKKVFSNFISWTNFFNTIFESQILFNSEMFLLFRSLKNYFNLFFKKNKFIGLLYKLIFKHFRSFFLPSAKSPDDYFLYQILTNNINTQPSNKYVFLLSTTKFETEKIQSFYLTNLICFNFYKNFFNFILINQPTKINLFFLNQLNINLFNVFTTKAPDFISKNSSYENIERIFLNFFIEFFYELISNFLRHLNLKKNYKKINSSSNKNLFASATSINFSYFLFNSLNKNHMKIFNRRTTIIIVNFQISLFSYLQNNKVLKNFIKNIKIYFFTITNLFTINNNLDFLMANLQFINSFFYNRNLWLKFLNNLFGRLNSDWENNNYTPEFQNFIFNFLSLSFNNCLETFFIEFLLQYSKIIFKS
jgi:hypothetical protein